MYAIYSVSRTTSRAKYEFLRQISLFGCNSGLIIEHLRSTLGADSSEPYPWHLPISVTLGAKGHAAVIDLKPNNRDSEGARSLYELLDVWGYSNWGWTPLMMRLRGLVIDGNPAVSDSRSFEIDPEYHPEPIFSFLYLAGTVRDGKIHGKWTAPRASPTNSVLLWPYSLSYFVKEIRRVSPEALEKHPVGPA